MKTNKLTFQVQSHYIQSFQNAVNWLYGFMAEQRTFSQIPGSELSSFTHFMENISDELEKGPSRKVDNDDMFQLTRSIDDFRMWITGFQTVLLNAFSVNSDSVEGEIYTPGLSKLNILMGMNQRLTEFVLENAIDNTN